MLNVSRLTDFILFFPPIVTFEEICMKGNVTILNRLSWTCTPAQLHGLYLKLHFIAFYLGMHRYKYSMSLAYKYTNKHEIPQSYPANLFVDPPLFANANELPLHFALGSTD